MPATIDQPMPAIGQLRAAHTIFLDRESRDVFYRAASEILERAYAGESAMSPAEAIAVLLTTWNAAYYRFHPDLVRRLVPDLDQLINRHRSPLTAFRARGIESFGVADEGQITSIFNDFQAVLKVVGTGKALHLLAPRFFPIWDVSIAVRYEVAAMKAPQYLTFMRISQDQLGQLGGQDALEHAINEPPKAVGLKLLDEYNYCCFSKNWMTEVPEPIAGPRGRG